MRKRKYYLLSGSIFAVWLRIEAQIEKKLSERRPKDLQVARMKTAEGRKIVGVIVPGNCVYEIIKDLETDSMMTDIRME